MNAIADTKVSEIYCKSIISFKEIDDYKEDILKLISSESEFDPNAHIEHIKSVVSNSPEIIAPFIIIGYKDDVPVSMLMSRIQKDTISINIGYKKLFTIKSLAMVFIYGGLVETLDEAWNNEINRLYVSEIMKMMRNLKVDNLKFNAMRVNSSLYKYLKSSPISRLYYYSKPGFHYKLRIPGSMEEYFKSKSKGIYKNHIYYEKKLNKAYKNINLYCFKISDDVNKLLNDVEIIAKKTYQRGIGVGFEKNILTEQRFMLAAEMGWLHSYVLYIDCKPVCFQLGFLFKDGYFLQGKGFDPSFKDFRIGNYLFFKMLESLIGLKCVNFIDFGIGEADYKEMFCNERYLENTCIFFNYRMKSVIQFLACFISNNLNSLGKQILARLRIEKRIKRNWRNLKEN